MRRTRRAACPPSRLVRLDALTLARRPEDAATSLRIGVLVAAGVTTADVVQALDGLGSVAACEAHVVGRAPGAVAAVDPSGVAVAAYALASAPPVDVVVLPGGLGWRALADDPAIVRWIRHAAREARAVLAISTGANVAAAAGLLTGEPATGHWLARRDLAALGARAVDAAVVEAAHVVTAGGAHSARAAGRRLAQRLCWAPT